MMHYPLPPRAHAPAAAIQNPPPRDCSQIACSVEIVGPPEPLV
jgi:hypothetical protein